MKVREDRLPANIINMNNTNKERNKPNACRRTGNKEKALSDMEYRGLRHPKMN